MILLRARSTRTDPLVPYPTQFRYGEQVVVDTVLVGEVLARPLPDDPEGRLYIPLEGGPATLYLRGQAVRGRWEEGAGVRFVSERSEEHTSELQSLLRISYAVFCLNKTTQVQTTQQTAQLHKQ